MSSLNTQYNAGINRHHDIVHHTKEQERQKFKNLPLKKKMPVAIVTGSNKGIGLGIVRALCKQFKGEVYLTSRDEARGKAAVAELNKEGLKPLFHVLDIGKEETIVKLRDFIKEKHGGIDILVNNAGIAFKGSATESVGHQVSLSLL